MAQVEKIAGGYRATAGPVFSRRGYLLFSDVPANRILKWEHGEATVFRESSHGAKANTFDHQGRLLSCETGRVTRTEKDGQITVLADHLKDPADLVYAIDGSIYFTDPAAPAVYQITRDGKVNPVSHECEHPFGVALTGNQQHLLVSDRGRRRIDIFDIAGNGSLGKARLFAACEEEPGGLKTDEAGDVWFAGSTGIHQLNSAGKRVQSIAVPEPPTNCNWGEGFQNLYITAGSSVYRAAARANGTRTY